MDIRLWIVIGLVAVSVFSGIVIKVRNEALKQAKVEVERQNNAAGNSSDSARDQFDLCPDGMWNYGTGRCKRP